MGQKREKEARRKERSRCGGGGESHRSKFGAGLCSAGLLTWAVEAGKERKERGGVWDRGG